MVSVTRRNLSQSVTEDLLRLIRTGKVRSGNVSRPSAG